MSTELLEQTAPPSGAVQVNRRKFLIGTTCAFALHFCMPGMSRAALASGAPAPTQLNSYIQINGDNTVTAYFGGCEFGQGAMSGLTQLLAEELMVAWSQIQVQTAVAGSISYITGGSSAISNNYLPLRQAGAAVRTMLIQAAATSWNVPVAECVATNGTVVHDLGSDAGGGMGGADGASLDWPCREPDYGQHNVDGRRSGPQDRAGLHYAGHPGCNGGEAAREVDVATGRGLQQGYVPTDGAFEGYRRPG